MSDFPILPGFLAGFECATHRRGDRTRLDLIASTRHDTFCERDYALARRHGMATVRDGLRWHLIEPRPRCYDFSSALPMIEAASRQNTAVIWDLCHYGYPDWLDIWSAEFPERFAAFCYQATRLIRRVSGSAPLVCPVNEISFWSWIGGKEGKINPYAVGKAPALKRQLAIAALAGISAARQADPSIIIFTAEPLINIVRDTNHRADVEAAAAYHASQYETVDMLLGMHSPKLGGHPDAVDVIGTNYYPHNQWRIKGGFVPLGHHDYRPLADLLQECHDRYRKPILITETGAEHSARSAWLAYVGSEVRDSLTREIPVIGICIYPILEQKGWDNDRICQVGLLGSPCEKGTRTVCSPHADEIERQMSLFSNFGWTSPQQLDSSRT